MSAADSGEAGTADRVNFVDEDQTGRILARLLKHIADPARADTDKHLHKIRSADGKERHIRLAGNRFGHQGLSGSRRTEQQRSFRNVTAEHFVFQGILEIINDFLCLLFRLIAACDVVEFLFIFVGGNHAGAAFSELHGALPRHFQLTRKQEIDESDDQNPDHQIDDQVCPPVFSLEDFDLAEFLKSLHNGGGLDDTGGVVEFSAGFCGQGQIGFVRSGEGLAALVFPFDVHDIIRLGGNHRSDHISGLQILFELGLAPLDPVPDGRSVFVDKQRHHHHDDQQPDQDGNGRTARRQTGPVHRRRIFSGLITHSFLPFSLFTASSRRVSCY